MNCYHTNKTGKETGTLNKQNWKGDRNTKQTVSGLLAVISSACLAMMENIAFSTLNRFAVPCGWKQF